MLVFLGDSGYFHPETKIQKGSRKIGQEEVKIRRKMRGRGR